MPSNVSSCFVPGRSKGIRPQWQSLGAMGKNLKIPKASSPPTGSLKYKYWSMDQMIFSNLIYSTSNLDSHAQWHKAT